MITHASFLAVDSSKEMVGTFSPQSEPYTHVMPEETTPSGMFARGSYSARTKVSISFFSDYLLLLFFFKFLHNFYVLDR